MKTVIWNKVKILCISKESLTSNKLSPSVSLNHPTGFSKYAIFAKII